MNNTVSTIEEFLERVKATGKPYQLDRIIEAYKFSAEAHKKQVRHSGEPYIVHPLSVCSIVLELGMDTETIIAAMLHDVVEDTEASLEEISKRFGKETAMLVDGVTKISQIKYASKEEEQAENFRKMLLAMAKDIRVIIIKLADRLHNARTFNYLPEEKRNQKALETIELYAPLADRLGIRKIKEELEDICIKYLDPIAVQEIEKQLISRSKRQAFLESIQKRIMERLVKDHPNTHIEGRVKSTFGIYRKVYIQGRSFDEVFDIYAVRLICDTPNECYNLLGQIHDMFVPIPTRFKDFISMPKSNMYQSLQTTVIDDVSGVPFEVQIRTWDMHQTAEYGIAAHWKYKAGVSKEDSLDERLNWVRKFLENQRETGGDAEDMVEELKTDIASHEVFVFTPNGDVKRMPRGSTVIDFAYAIHSAVGNRMVGAKINGHIAPVDTEVKTGMVIEIITGNKNQGPNRDWLNKVKTSEAKNKIRTWFKKERREENIEEGRSLLERELKRFGIVLSEEEFDTFVLNEGKKLNYDTADDTIAAIGYGAVLVSRIAPHIRDEYQASHKASEMPQIEITRKNKTSSSGVIVENLDDCLVKFAKCCNPLPGDSIIGFVTRGYGVSIHKRDCINVKHGLTDIEQKGRWVDAEWSSTSFSESFRTTVEVISANRQGILADVTVLINNLRIPVVNFTARGIKDGQASFLITMEVTDITQLDYVISQIRKVQGVEKITRVAG